MMSETGLRRTLPDQSSGSAHTFGTPRHPSVIDPIPSKRVCFYKSGDPQFSGLRMVINNRTFKTFDALLDSLSKKVPLPFGVRNITTPRGVHAVNTLDDLEDGKSYICSDTRKVKPINLALARKKPPPWYHARQASSRRQAVKQARAFPGGSLQRREPAVVRTPKRLLVFRNGDPTTRHTVVIQKRTTPTFESILEYISELLQFAVMKLHTPDGGRVDGVPGLILCSGVVVAAGREPFSPANYNSQKSPGVVRQPSTRSSVRKPKSINRKKAFPSKLRHFSPSSERYIVNQIHNSMAESSCDLPSNRTNSETGHLLESVAETDVEAEGLGGTLPSEDDIEKSFRVNQDGSMTVEMRVRLTIKEEETLHWTTTLTRSSVANQLDMTYLPEPEPEKAICSPESSPLDLRNPAASNDSVNKDRNKDDDEDPPSLGNGALSGSSQEEENVNTRMDAASPRSAPTPGHMHIRTKQASVESIRSLRADGISEGALVGSYSCREQTENGAVTEQYCVVQQSRRPVPKPRRIGSMDSNNVTSRNVSSFKSAEILQIESSGDEVTETVLHIYEQQTCHDNYFANVYRHDGSSSGMRVCRPATSETGQLSSSYDLEPEPWRPSTASESISIFRAESKSVTSDFTSSQVTNRKHPIPKSTKDQVKQRQRVASNDKRQSVSPKVVNKRFSRVASPGKRQRRNAAEAARKVNPLSSAGAIKRIYGNTSAKGKKKRVTKQKGSVAGKSSQPSGAAKTKVASVEMSRSEVPAANQPRGVLTRQTSMHRGKKNGGGLNASSAVTSRYVENWLEKAHVGGGSMEGVHVNAQKSNPGFTCGAQEVNPDMQTRETLGTDPLPSVKQRIQSFENKSVGELDNTSPLSMEFPPPPVLSDTENDMMGEPSVAGSPSFFVRPAGVDHMSINPPSQADCPLTAEEHLRSAAVKRAPLLSNTSLERKMSLRRACVDSYALTTRSVEGEKAPADSFSAPETQRPQRIHADDNQQSTSDRMSCPSCCSSASPAASTSEERTSPASVSSTASLTNPPLEEKPSRSLSPESKLQTRKGTSNAPGVPPLHTSMSPTAGKQLASASPERQRRHKPGPQRNPSPYSQSLDMTSPPVRHGSHRRLLSRNLSSEDSSESQTQRKISWQRKSGKSSAVALVPLDAEMKGELRNADEQTTQTTPNDSEQEVRSNVEEDGIMEENITEEMMDALDLPGTLKEEPASLSEDVVSKRGETNENGHDSQEDGADLGSVIKHRTNVHQLEISGGGSELGRMDQDGQEQHDDEVQGPPVEQEVEQISKDLYSAVRFGDERGEGVRASESQTEDQESSVEERTRSCSSESEVQQQTPREEGFPSPCERESGPGDARQGGSDQSEREVSGCNSGAGEGEEEEAERNSEGDVSDPESRSEEEEETPTDMSCYVELKICRKGSTSSTHEEQLMSETEGEERDKELVAQATATSSSEKDPERPPNISLNPNTSDVDDPSSSGEEQLEAELTLIAGQASSSPEGEDPGEERKEGTVTVEDLHADEAEIQSTYQMSDGSSVSEHADLHSSFDEEDGAEHVNHSKAGEEQSRSFVDDYLSYYDKESSSEGERACPVTESASEETQREKPVEAAAKPCEDVMSQSVAERVSLLEKQAAGAQGNVMESSPRSSHVLSDVEEASTCPTDPCTRSAPQSSLSFSYDSSGVMAAEPEGNRVKSIREMFLAKSSADSQHGQRCSANPKATDLPEGGADASETPETSAETSGGEEDSSRKSITKGFVRRTIERLYGKSDVHVEQDARERSPSAPKQKNKVHSNIFAHLDTARSKAMSELSYFSSSNAVDALTEAAGCVAFNAQVVPREGVAHDPGGGLLRENAAIRKSVSDPVGINKNFANAPREEDPREDTREKTPRAEPEDKKSCLKKCTYFSLPHASDSEACQDDLSVVGETHDGAESGETRAQRNGTLGDFKLRDNKVHPLTEASPDGEVVVMQPRKGQGVVNRIHEPDVLDLLYNFCGEHCPIL